MDNASIHTAKVVKTKARELGIELVYNLPYKPHFLGITHLWAYAKANYKEKLTQLRYSQEAYKNLTVVTKLMLEIT